MNRKSTITVASALTLAAGLLCAGPLTPPAGPIASTNKPLAELEPRVAISTANTPGDSDSMFKISSPGSYYLTANVLTAPDKVGIEIASDGVTLDLNGFRIGGFPGSLDAVRTSGTSRTNITVKNGSVGPISGNGISLGFAGDSAHACRIEDITAVNCAQSGIAADDAAVITRCIVSDCGVYGIYLPTSGTISDCIVTRCSTGILLTNEGSIDSCLVTENQFDGILITGNARITNNTCTSNGTQSTTGAGIHVFGSGSHGARIQGNHCADNDRGIWAEGTGTTILANTCSANPWVIAAGNYYGPIIDRVNAATPGVFGTSAAGTLNTSDPNANFTY